MTQGWLYTGFVVDGHICVTTFLYGLRSNYEWQLSSCFLGDKRNDKNALFISVKHSLAWLEASEKFRRAVLCLQGIPGDWTWPEMLCLVMLYNSSELEWKENITYPSKHLISVCVLSKQGNDFKHKTFAHILCTSFYLMSIPFYKYVVKTHIFAIFAHK